MSYQTISSDKVVVILKEPWMSYTVVTHFDLSMYYRLLVSQLSPRHHFKAWWECSIVESSSGTLSGML